MEKIQLNELEIKISHLIAVKRYEMARGSNVPNGQVSDSMGALEPDIEGVLAEMAFCKAHGIYPRQVLDIFVRSKKNGMDYGDATVKFMGETRVVDVKTTCYKNGRLICSVVNPNVDYYALMVGQKGEYRMAGLMEAHELCRESRYGDHGLFKKPCYMAEQHELKSWKDLRNA
tara:strand:- start:13442 stop:13960 length:519 start_codon:yes stop_codon:yes gene_type:complete